MKYDNRWWEFYFVRYFVGTAIGAIVVLFLVKVESPVFSSQGQLVFVLDSLKQVRFQAWYLVALTTIGLAFSYIASAPVLVIHAVRGRLLKTPAAVSRGGFVFFLLVVIFVSLVQVFGLWFALDIQGNPWLSMNLYVGSFVLILVSFIAFGQIFLLIPAIRGLDQDSFDYYDKLVERRASAGASGIEYVESYRHLREHGNAFSIALLELLFGAALFYSPVPWAIVLVTWITPAACVWLFGTLMESREF